MSVFYVIAYNDGSLGTIWGPCTDGSKLTCDCPQCQNANRIEAEGLSWDEEYEKARLRNFDRKEN